MHIAASMAIARDLIPALERLHKDLAAKAKQWDKIVKIGRTHLMDATPIRVGQVFSGYAAQAEYATVRASRALKRLEENMPIGGTAVGTGINTHPRFAAKVCVALSNKLGGTFTEAANHPEAQAAKDSFVEAHGELKTIAVSLSKIANDIRLLGSGPRCSIFELSLPATQPGSSIMPGKVNPVIAESAIQVACRVLGNDTVVTTSALGGIGSLFELNVAMPVMIDAFLESVKLLANVTNVFVDKLLTGLEVNEERCRRADRTIADDGHVARPQNRLRKSGRIRQRSIRHRQNDSRALPRTQSAARQRARRRSRSLEDDRTTRIKLKCYDRRAPQHGRSPETKYNGVRPMMARKLSVIAPLAALSLAANLTFAVMQCGVPRAKYCQRHRR